MDNFVKITTGYVKQYYELNEDGVFMCTVQEFKAIDIIDYVDDSKKPIKPPEYKYQSFDMVQPKSTQQENLLNVAKEIVSDFNRYGEVLQVGNNGEYGTESTIGRLSAIVKQIEGG